MSDIESYIKEHFIYNENGTITRNDRKNSNGSLDKYGYLIIKIKGKQYKAHKIVWLLNYGHFPEKELDHINRNKLDNRISNLRESNRIQQNLNKDFKPNKNTNVIGIYIDNTKGLKKKYCFKFKNKSYRFYKLQDAIKNKEKLRRKYYEYI